MFNFMKKSATIRLDQLNEIAGFMRFGSSSGEAVTPETAVQVSAVLCAVRVIAEGIGQMPIRVIREEWDGDSVQREVVRDHWAHKLLSEKPNGFQTGFELREYAIIAALLDKGFLAIKNVVGNEVRELLPLPMGAWDIERQANKWDHYFRVSYANGTHGVFTPSQVVYMRGPSLDGFKAFPALAAAREAIGLSRAIEKQQAKLAGNGGKPSGVLAFDETLKPEAREKLAALWGEKFGPNGDGGIAVLDRAAKFTPMTMTSVDAQHIDTRRFQVEEVARAFRVHPNKLMHSSNQSTHASAESFARTHVVDTLGPWMRRMEEVFNRDILGNSSEYRVDLDERALLRGDFSDQAEYYTKALGAGGQPGWMTPNEIRRERDMNRINEPWADTVPRGAMNPDTQADKSPEVVKDE